MTTQADAREGSNSLLQPGGTIVADASSLIYLNRVGVLPQYCRLKAVSIPLAVWHELLAGHSQKHEEDYNVYHMAITQKMMRVFPDRQTCGPSRYSGLSNGDVSVIRLYESIQAQGVLTDDGGICRYCRSHAIAYLNAPLALVSLGIHGAISGREARLKIDQVLRFGRYTGDVSDYVYRLADRYNFNV